MNAKKLKSGDTIGVIAPSKCANKEDRECIKKAEIFFNSIGLNIKYGKYIYEDSLYPNASAKDRANEINKMFADKDVNAIFTLKGGELSNGLLTYIDYELIKSNPKIFMGMSDITILLCAIYEKTGLITFHGNDFVNFGKDFISEYDKNEIIERFFNSSKLLSPFTNRIFKNFDDIIEGKVIGTNISTLEKLYGTEFMPSEKDYIFFLEGYSTDIYISGMQG